MIKAKETRCMSVCLCACVSVRMPTCVHIYIWVVAWQSCHIKRSRGERDRERSRWSDRGQCWHDIYQSVRLDRPSCHQEWVTPKHEFIPLYIFGGDSPCSAQSLQPSDMTPAWGNRGNKSTKDLLSQNITAHLIHWITCKSCFIQQHQGMKQSAQQGTSIRHCWVRLFIDKTHKSIKIKGIFYAFVPKFSWLIPECCDL